MRKVRKGEDGLFIMEGNEIYRPGYVSGPGHRMRMDAAGLVAGDMAKTLRVAGTRLLRVTLEDGTITFWHADGEARRSRLMPEPPGAIWRKDGKRDPSNIVIGQPDLTGVTDENR